MQPAATTILHFVSLCLVRVCLSSQAGFFVSKFAISNLFDPQNKHTHTTGKSCKPGIHTQHAE
jgi:hypothetical protein